MYKRQTKYIAVTAPHDQLIAVLCIVPHYIEIRRGPTVVRIEISSSGNAPNYEYNLIPGTIVKVGPPMLYLPAPVRCITFPLLLLRVTLLYNNVKKYFFDRWRVFAPGSPGRSWRRSARPMGNRPGTRPPRVSPSPSPRGRRGALS